MQVVGMGMRRSGLLRVEVRGGEEKTNVTSGLDARGGLFGHSVR